MSPPTNQIRSARDRSATRRSASAGPAPGSSTSVRSGTTASIAVGEDPVRARVAPADHDLVRDLALLGDHVGEQPAEGIAELVGRIVLEPDATPEQQGAERLV